MGDIVGFPKPRQDAILTHSSPSNEEVDIVAAKTFPQAVLFLARKFVAIHQVAPRTGGLFATQQRWLLCHAVLAQYFRDKRTDGPGLTRRDFGQIALRHGISSRNTALAFFDEALHYGIIRLIEGRGGEFEPSPTTVTLLTGWYDIHLRALDILDGNTRAVRFMTCSEDALCILAPLMADNLLSSSQVRFPSPLYAIFTWADAGGLLMDRLIAGADLDALNQHGRFVTDVTATSSLADICGLSRQHAARKIAAAESISGLGWTGRRGHSPMWISQAFYEEYAVAQANKLMLLDKAFEMAMAVLRSVDR